MYQLLFAVALAAASVEPPAGELRGRITNPEGTALAGARVTVLELNRAAVASPEGTYVVSGLPRGTFSVSFALVGYAPEVRRVSIGEQPVTLDLTLRRSAIELPEIQTTASPLATTALNAPQPTSVLGGDDLHVTQAPSLGETVSVLPGIRSVSTGTGIGKPVIRGLTSNRVLVLADGQRLENQQWGDEHGPNVEPGDAARIEVIRGPASVLYGSDALGGVINVISRPIPDAIGRSPFVRGSLLAAYATNNEQPDGTFSLEGASGSIGVRASATGRTSNDIRTPTGSLFNSANEAWSATGGLGYRGDWGTIELDYAHRDERLEIHEDPAEDPTATPFQRVGDDRAHLTSSFAVGAAHLDVDLGFQRNRRREFEEDGATDVALGLLAKTYTGDVRFHHQAVGPFAGIIGVAGEHETVSKFGEETLVPETDETGGALFVSEQAELGRWRLSAGARYDHRTLDVEDDAELGITAERRTYNSVTGSLGVLYRVSDPLALVLNVGRGFRSPTPFELFANGVHEGTVRFERGDPTLRNETSINTDVAVRVQSSNVNAEVGGFLNYVENYIHPRPTGEIDLESGFEIFEYTQGDARLYGLESVVEYHPTAWLHLRGTADFVRGQNTSRDVPLPFIPPFRATYAVRLEQSAMGPLREAYFSVQGESNARQRKLDPDDFAPDGYTLVHLGGGITLPAGAREIRLDLQLRNAFDEAYGNFLNRYKAYALDQGRNLIARVSTTF